MERLPGAVAVTRPACGPAMPPLTRESVPRLDFQAGTAYPPPWVVQPASGVSKLPFWSSASAHQPRRDGVASALPAASTARTSSSCRPFATWKVGALPQAEKAPPSSRHSKLAPASDAEKAKSAEPDR